jgi:SAM-dependent methyltransferase
MEIVNTGERILLEKESPLMIARHFCAYRFAKDYAENKRVLDIGCGEGYGSSYLADFAKEVIGVDYDKSIIDYAKDKYKKNNLAFYVIDAKELDYFDNRFDTVCSFQVIEHIQDTKTFLENVIKLLTNSGVFICSTPNRLDASPNRITPLNKFHVKEYLLHEFMDLLQRSFGSVDIFGLKRGKSLDFYRKIKKAGLFNFFPSRINPVEIFYRQIKCDNFIITKDNLGQSLDFITVCRK